MKRVLSFLLALMLTISMIPNVFAAEDIPGIDYDEINVEDFTYTVANNEATITGYTGAGGDITIPSTLGGYPVVALQEYLFLGNDSLTSVVIPNSVVVLGEGTFDCCENLSAVTLPANLTVIPDSLFATCTSLEAVTIPDSVTTIGKRAFRFCTKLSSITISANVTQIGHLAFDNCDKLNGIWVEAGNANYCSDDKGVLFNKTKTDLIWAPQCLSGLYEIPATVTTIHQSAFEHSALEAITIPDGVVTIDREAFNGCDFLYSLIIPDSVTSLGYRAVANNDSLQTLMIGNGLTTLSEAVFYGNPKLTSVAIPNGVTTIGPAALAGCAALKRVTIPASVTFIDAYAFASPVIADVYFGGTQEQWDAISVGEGNEYLLNATLHIVADREFVYEIENGNAIITGYEGVGGDVVVPVELDGYRVTAIGKNAFRECYTLNSVVLPDSVTAIGVNAFWDCRKLKSIIIPNNLTVIDDFAFYRCEELASVNIPEGVTRIGDYAFQWCSSLGEITIPGGIDTRVEGIFYDCDSLTKVTFGEGLKAIPSNSFAGSAKLKTVWIPSSVTKIGYCAFGNCTSLSEIYYGGNQSQWKAINVSEDNDPLLKATILYNYGTHTHKYSKGKCTVCGYKPAGAKITTQPVNVAVKSGKTAKVTVKATGTGLKYTWYYAKKGSSKFTKTTVTSASYSVKMSSSVNGRKVYCVVTDKYGNTVKSSTVTLYKGTPAKITTQPKGITVANGKTGSITLKASGSSLKYQWYIKYKGATSWTKVGKSSKTYSFKMASKLSGAQAYCVVKDKYGITVKSSVVTIKLAPQPKITTQPKSVLQVSGKTVKFTVKASGEGLKYQWYYANKGSSSYKKVSGAKKATLSIKVSSSVNGRKYYCLVTDKYGQTVKSSAATLTMKTVAKITTQPKSVTVKNGKTAKVTIKAVGDGLTYTWYYLKPGATKYTKSSITSATFSVKMAAAWKNAKVYCVIADKYGNTVKSKVVTMKMK